MCISSDLSVRGKTSRERYCVLRRKGGVLPTVSAFTRVWVLVRVCVRVCVCK